MRIKSFDDAFELLMIREGGYSNNPSDPGGETMFGITKRVALLHGYSGPMRDLPVALAKSIAKTEYWDKVRGDELPPELAFQLFDVIYNGGKAVQWLQRALGVTVDGDLGPKTLAAANAANLAALTLRFNAERLEYLANLSTWPTFGKGWVRRIAANLREGAD